MNVSSEMDPRWSRWLAIVAFLAVLIWVAWSAVRGFWIILNEPQLPSVSEHTGVSAPQTQTVTSSVADWHLFGHGAAPVQPQQQVRAATDSGLQLLGTLASPDPEAGKAIIASVSGVQDVYSAGAELPGGAVLREVHSAHVVIELNGAARQLQMEQAAVSSTPKVNVPPVATTPNVATAVSGAQVDWNAIRSGMRMDPTQLANNISVLPHMENGQQVGVRINAGRNSTLLRQLGLTSNDVVLAVNGQKLDDPSRFMQLVNDLKSARQVTVTYRRNGKEYTRDIQIPQ